MIPVTIHKHCAQNNTYQPYFSMEVTADEASVMSAHLQTNQCLEGALYKYTLGTDGNKVVGYEYTPDLLGYLSAFKTKSQA